MENLIKEMEDYALVHDVPIMQKEGIEFFQNLIQKNNIKTILEVGTAIGYSAIQLARLDKEIQIVSIERDDVRYEEAVKNVNKSGLENQIRLIHGDALETDVDGYYDCIFIDAAKAQYIKFFEKYCLNLAEKGIIVSDNLSFHGFVDHPEKKMSRNLRQLVGKIKRYIVYLENNEEYETEFFELGDGVAVSRKRD